MSIIYINYLSNNHRQYNKEINGVNESGVSYMNEKTYWFR